MEAVVFIILHIFFATRGTKRNAYEQLTDKNVYRVWYWFFGVFWYRLSTSRFISSSVTKANCSPILTLILTANLKPWSFGKWEISPGECHSDVPEFWLGHIRSPDAFRPIACERQCLMDYNHCYRCRRHHYRHRNRRRHHRRCRRHHNRHRYRQYIVIVIVSITQFFSQLVISTHMKLLLSQIMHWLV